MDTKERVAYVCNFLIKRGYPDFRYSDRQLEHLYDAAESIACVADCDFDVSLKVVIAVVFSIG